MVDKTITEKLDAIRAKHGNANRNNNEDVGFDEFKSKIVADYSKKIEALGLKPTDMSCGGITYLSSGHYSYGTQLVFAPKTLGGEFKGITFVLQPKHGCAEKRFLKIADLTKTKIKKIMEELIEMADVITADDRASNEAVKAYNTRARAFLKTLADGDKLPVPAADTLYSKNHRLSVQMLHPGGCTPKNFIENCKSDEMWHVTLHGLTNTEVAGVISLMSHILSKPAFKND